MFLPPANCMDFDTAFPAIITAQSPHRHSRTDSSLGPPPSRDDDYLHWRRWTSSLPRLLKSSTVLQPRACLPRTQEFAQEAIGWLDGKGMAGGTHLTVDAAIPNLLARGAFPILRSLS